MTADATAPLPARFVDPRPLGRGAFGEVWSAFLDGAPVAVKLLDPQLASRPDAAWAFAAEWRTLARLAHPAFPQALEEGRTEAGQPYYAMGLLPGAAPEPGAGALLARVVVAGVAEALAYLHGAGLVHGDLKPDNLRVGPDGVVRVLDLGLAAPVGRRREAIAGTPAYMAPEVLKREALDGRADLYALGALAYELWTGETPFTGGTAALVRAHLAAPVPAIADAAADPALAELVAALLAKDPAARPAGARTVLARLAGAPDPADEAPAALQGGALVAREGLLAAWQGVLAGPGGRLAIAGGPGLGKTRALDALRVEALLAGRTWVGAAGRAGDAPGASLRSVVAQAVAAAGLTPGADLAAWLAGKLPPGLAELEPVARRVAQAALVADALAAAGGLAIGLDDWHLADEASRDLAALVARGSGPVAWALAYATEAGTSAGSAPAIAPASAPADDQATGPTDAVATAPTDGPATAPADGPATAPADGPGGQLAAGAPLVTLTPLNASDATALVTARLGAAPPAALLERIVPLAAGRPALLDMLLEHLAAGGALRRGPAGWTLAATGAEAGALPASLEAAWTARLAGLPTEARALAGVLAVAAPAGALPAPLLLAAARLTDGAAASAALLAEGLAVAEGGRLRLAVAALAPGLRAGVSASVATELARHLLLTDELTAAATLALAGDDTPLAADLAERAGLAALTQGAPAAALGWLDAAAAQGAPPAPLALPRAEALRLLDRLDEAASAYQAATSAEQPRTAAQAWLGLAKIRQMKGDYPGALEAFTAAEAHGEPDQRARAAVGEARVRAYRGEPDAALAAAARAEQQARFVGAEAVLAQALTMRGYLVASNDPTQVPAARAMLDEALAIGDRLGDRVGVALALDNLGNVLLAAGDLAGAAEVYDRAVAHCQAAGLATEGLAAALNQAIVTAERGDLASAITRAADVARRAEALGRKFVRAAALTAEAQARARRGEPDGAQALLEAALALATGIGNKLLEEHVRIHALEAALEAGDRDPADLVAQADQVAALVAETQHAEARARLGTLDAERLRQAGDLAGAEQAAARWADAPNQVAAHAARRVLAAVALARGDAKTAARHAQAALTIADAWAAPWHQAADRALLAASAPPAQAAPPPPTRSDGPLAIDLAAYAAWTTALAGATSDADLGALALDGAMALVGAERGYLLAYQAGRLQQAIARGLDVETEVAEGFSTSMVQRAMFTGEPLYVADARGDDTWSGATSVMALDLRAVVVLPLSTPRALLGVLYMDRQALTPLLGPADLQLLGAFATTAAAAIARERARGDAEAGWGLLATLTTRLLPDLDPFRVAMTLLAAAMEATGAERGFWLSRQADQGPWDVRLALAPTSDDISRGVADHVAATGEPLNLLNAAEDEAFQDRASVQALGLRTVWCLPVPGRPGELLYLDTTDLAQTDPSGALAGVEALLRYAAPLLG